MEFYAFMMKVFGWIFLVIAIASLVYIFKGATHQIFIFTAATIMAIGCFTDKQEELQ